jgi:hypothetical protein
METAFGCHSFCCTLCSVMATLTNNTILLSGRAMVTGEQAKSEMYRSFNVVPIEIVCRVHLFVGALSGKDDRQEVTDN